MIDKTGDYFYYKFLTNYTVEKFFDENGIKEYLFENNDYQKYKNSDMYIFVVGYIGISNIFITEKNPKITFISDMINYINTKSTCSIICFISIIVLGGYTVIAISISMSIGNTIAKLITMGIENLILLLIIISYFMYRKKPKSDYLFEQSINAQNNYNAHIINNYQVENNYPNQNNPFIYGYSNNPTYTSSPGYS